MFAVIHVPDFPLQAVLRRQPEGRLSPIALIDSDSANASKALVLECTESAKAAGVCVGLTAPQAQARCRELVLKARSLEAEQQVTNILLQAAYAFTPHIENTAAGVCTMDLRGLTFGGGIGSAVTSFSSKDALPQPSHQQTFGFLANVKSFVPRGESERLLWDWAEKILTALQQLNLDAQIGIAAAPNIALLAARTAAKQTVLVVEQTEEFFAHLPIEMLSPTPHVLNILKRWGIHTGGAFLALGRDAIAERLGAEALELFERASTDTIRPLDIVVPPDTFEEQMDFEAQIETLEPLLFVLRRFVEQLARRIELTYRVVAELQLTLTLESGAPYQRDFKVPAPTANAETLFRMLHTHLENLRTNAPIQSLHLGAVPCRSENQQFSLFESALRDPNHFHETLARLMALLGTNRVGTPVAAASHQPDTFQMKAPEFDNGGGIQNPKSKIQNVGGLCLRRFRPPVHADVEIQNGEPTFISTLFVSGRVKRARGPWCISGTWWDQRRWSRQEWDLETERGELYRVRNADGDWVVEGMYD